MAIADRINEMYTHVGDVYDTITNVDVNTGKNLFNKDTITKSSYLKEDGTLLTGTSQEYNTSDFIPVEPNTAYYKTQTLSPRTKFYDANKQALNTTTYQDVSIGGNSGTFTTPNNAHYFRFTINTNPTTGANINLAMVNKGTTALPYEPYTDNPTYKNIENIPKVIRNSYLEIMNNGIDKIWNNWEKVTGSGTELSLSPTLEAPMKNVLNGNTYQFTTTGKNLLPNNQTTQTINGLTFTVNDDKSITIRGTATANTDYYFVGTTSQYVDFGLTTGTYNLSGCSGGSEQTYMLFAVMNRNGSIYYYGSFVDTGRKMIVETGDTFRIFIRVISGQTMNTTMYPMVERGDNKTTYEPYTGGVVPRPEYPEDIHVVSGDNTIKVTGKNLLPINLTGGLASGITFTNNLDGTFSARGTSTAGVGQNICGEITLKAGTYTFSVNNLPTGVYLSLNNVGYTMLNSSTLKRIFTLNQDTTFPRCLLWVDSNKTIDTTFEVLLEKGNTATDFEPYSSDLYSIDLPIENLCNVSNTITTSAFGMNVTLSEDVVTCSGTPTRQYINTEAVNLINPLKAGNTYNFMAFSDNLPSECNFRIWGYNSDNVLKFNVKSGASLLITEDIIKYRLVLEGMTTGTSYNIQAKLQIEKGDKFNSYTPYGTIPIELNNNSTYKDYFIKTEGKNLCGTTFELGGIDTTTGRNGTGTDRVRTKDYVEIKPNTAYTLSGVQGSRVVCFYNFSKAYLSYAVVGSQSTSGTFTTPNDTSYIRWYIIQTNTNINEMLNEGSTVLPYEPYGSEEWYKCNQLSKYVLDGTQNIPLASGTPRRFNASYTTLGITNTKDGASATETQANYRMCDHFSYTSGKTTWGNYYLHNNWLVILDSESVIADANALKSWLSSNNTKIYYVLATPTYTKITYEPLLEQLEAFYNAKSKNSQTNITQENNDLPFIIDSTMLKEV